MIDDAKPQATVGLWLPLTLTLVSAASMALEIVAGRALAPYVGMSLYSWTMIIAVVLAGLSIGHWVGGTMADTTQKPERWVAISLTAAALATIASLGAIRFIAPSLVGFDPISHVGILSLVGFFLPSAIAGMLSPLLTKMALDRVDQSRHGRVLGLMFALGAFGAIIGTLVAGLLLISWVGTSGSVMIIAALYGLLSLRFWSLKPRIIAGLALLFAGVGLAQSPKLIGLQTPCLKESAYFCIRVDTISFLGRDSKVMALDHLAHGINDAKDPTLLLSPYVQGIDEIVRTRFSGSKLEAFFVGGGAYTLPRAWLASYPEGRFVTAELDPQVTKIGHEKMWLPKSNAHKIIHGDARHILRNQDINHKFDVIFGDAFHDISIPQHLVSDEFHELVKSRLKPDGLYAINVVDSLKTPRFLLSLVKTLKLQFPAVEVWLDIDQVQPNDSRVTWIIIASERETKGRRFTARHGFQRQWVRGPIKLMTEVVGVENLITLRDDFAPVDRLLAGLILNADTAE
ncbi:MAG: fused MFS/spermidine synthase [Rhizobiaceae bacterium]